MQCMGFLLSWYYAFFAEKTYVTGIQQNVVLNVSACSNNIAFCHDLSFWVLVWLVQFMITR